MATDDGIAQWKAKDKPDAEKSSLAEVRVKKSTGASTIQVTEADVEKWKTTYEFLAKDQKGVKLEDYIDWQVGSLSSFVQDQVKAQARNFATKDYLNMEAFMSMKKADEDREDVVNGLMFKSFDSDSDGQVAVKDLVEWTKKDAAAHGYELNEDQVQAFQRQYMVYSKGKETMDFEAFTKTQLAKVILQSKKPKIDAANQ